MKAVTANRLADGRVVYFGADQRWETNPDAALRLSSEEAEVALKRACADMLSVVGPYLIDLDEASKPFRPAGRKHVREMIRQTGPSAGSTRTLSQV